MPRQRRQHSRDPCSHHRGCAGASAAFAIRTSSPSVTAADPERASYCAGRLAELLDSLAYASLATKFHGASLALLLVSNPAAEDARYRGRALQRGLLLLVSSQKTIEDDDADGVVNLDMHELTSIVSFAPTAAAFWMAGPTIASSTATRGRRWQSPKDALVYCGLFAGEGSDEEAPSAQQRSRHTLDELSIGSSTSLGPTSPRRSKSVDRRLWSCTARQFSDLVGDLGDCRYATSDVHTLAATMQSVGLYPTARFRVPMQPSTPERLHHLHMD